jgi:predicted transcriptional regulator of viral defense system
MSRPVSASDHVLRIATRAGVVHAREVRTAGISHEYLRRMCAAGHLVRVGRGLYMPTVGGLSEYSSLVLCAKAVPKGVVCLISALRFHGVGTQLPSETWVAIQRGNAVPRIRTPRLHVIRMSGLSFSAGQEMHQLNGVRVKVYSVAKTVADCFKFRAQVGLDVALEALRESIRLKKATRDAIWRHANHCRVANIIRPYLEAIA